jgi:hypothetical protein
MWKVLKKLKTIYQGYLKLANCRHASESRVEAHVAWILLFSAIQE